MEPPRFARARCPSATMSLHEEARRLGALASGISVGSTEQAGGDEAGYSAAALTALQREVSALEGRYSEVHCGSLGAMEPTCLISAGVRRRWWSGRARLPRTAVKVGAGAPSRRR